MNVPRLRFKDFTGEWEVKLLGEISQFLDGRRRPIKESDRSKMKGQYPYYGASGIIDYVNNFIFDEDIILLGEDGENILSRNLPLAFKVSGKCWVNNHAHVIKPNHSTNIDFLTQYLDNISYVKYNSGTAQPKLNQEVCRTIPLNLPCLSEQTKIANFLTAVDEKISQLTQKCDLLKQYKKGVMQQIFSQKLRFKDDDGQEFPEWEELNFDDGFYLANNKKAQVKSSDYSEAGHTPVIDQGQKTIVGYTNNKYVYDDVPVIIFGDHTRILKWIDFKFAPGADGTQVIKTTKRLILKFGYYYLCHIELPNLGYSRHMKEMKKQCSFAPASLKEQTKIANFLTAIDDKITQAQTQLEAVKQYKKGLLQQLFV